MGVTKLWQLLKERGEGEETRLSHCSGQSWAVDLSGWILNARTAAGGISGCSADTTMIRTVFYRALCLMKHGIRPVFVMDGNLAPEVKSQTMQDRSEKTSSGTKLTANDRSGIQRVNMKCQEMLEALGLQVISSSGEAEKTCALLNLHGIVDACLSDDSDSFLYGASIVYRNLDVGQETVDKHTSCGIEDKLKLSRRDLVVMALLSGCDYGDGVKGIGPKKVVDLVAAIRKYSSDVLQRVCSWRDNTDLNTFELERQNISKPTHCTQCLHTGSKSQHRKTGCEVCGSTTDCLADSGRECPCDYHTMKRRTDPYMEEINIRQKAVKMDNFPDHKLIQEFLDDDRQEFDLKAVKPAMPRWEELVERVSIPPQDLMRKLVPVLVHMHLHGILELPDACPQSILKDCKRNFVRCYLVTWKQFAFDKWTCTHAVNTEETPTKDLERDNPYVVAVPCRQFEDKYPEMVSVHKCSTSEKKTKGKRKHLKDDKYQGKLSDFFTVIKGRKKLNFGNDGQK